MATEAAPAAAEHSVKTATEYVLLAHDDPITTPTGAQNRWLEVGKVSARSAEAAVKAYAEKSKASQTVTLVAVPSRSWVPMRVAVKTETKLEVSAVAS